ncbi:MAG: hypothetical protein CL551_16440 [Alcanivorax sp.]|nr:hypothetical protein [Alcanivorax sp.]MBI55860.1 hypothetical protein [Alcanivorax sp.]HCE39596.1 hypothetical protein [Alcanivorax sp.]|tara:strand:- start:345 stop:1124 length:780 start_codon:yes stop_codon:yes gene_type:complete
MFYEQDATGQILSLSRVTTLGRLRAGLSYLVEAHGFRYYMFTCLGAELERTRTLVLHNLPCEQPAPPWPLETDPLAQYALAESLPLDWRGLMARPDFLARGYQVTMRQRAALGLRAGCTVPLLQGPGILAWLDLALDRDDDDAWAHVRRYLPCATLLGRVVLDRVGRFLAEADDNEPPPEPLSDRERACLRGASEGLSNIEIGASLGISERTVSSHIHRACHKLRARNRQHAITKAVLSLQLYAALGCPAQGSGRGLFP